MTTAPAPPTWDLTDYFDAFDSDAQRAFAAQLQRDIEAADARLRALPAIGAGDAWLADWARELIDLEELSVRIGHLGSYLGCLRATDTRDEAVQRAIGELASTSAQFEKLFVLVQAAFKTVGDGAFAQLVAHPDLASAAYLLGKLRREAQWTMDAELEELNADLAVDGFGAWGRLYSKLAGGLTFEVEEGGERKTIPMSRYRSLLAHPERAVRQAAFDGASAAWAQVESVAAAALNAIAGTRHTLYRRRGVPHFLEPALQQSGVTRATLDAMMQAIADHRELPRRFLRRKAQVLGLDRLGWWDLAAPLPLPERDPVDWATAEARVREAFDRVYPALGTYAAQAFDRRWIDAAPGDGRSPGGFCTSSAMIGQSRIFMTYDETLDDVQTLAHELGHAFHNDVMREQRYWTRRYPMTLAETASTFAETALTDAILEADDCSPITQLEVLGTRLENAEAFLLNIPMRYHFERAFYEERQAGEVAVSRLKELVCAAQRDSYGDAVADDALDPYFWAWKLHFYITGVSFYNFPYAFGYLFSLAIYERAQQEGPGFLATFEELLARTGSDTAEGVARAVLGVDLEDPTFWAGPMRQIEADLERFDALAAAHL